MYHISSPPPPFPSLYPTKTFFLIYYQVQVSKRQAKHYIGIVSNSLTC